MTRNPPTLTRDGTTETLWFHFEVSGSRNDRMVFERPPDGRMKDSTFYAERLIVQLIRGVDSDTEWSLDAVRLTGTDWRGEHTEVQHSHPTAGGWPFWAPPWAVEQAAAVLGRANTVPAAQAGAR